MGGWSPRAQRAVWTVAALPFAFTITLGGPVIATLLALWLRRGGRRRGPAWRLWWFVGVSWLLVPSLLAIHLLVTGIDIAVEHARRTEFAQAAWRSGDREDRTTMAHDLVESGQLVGLPEDEVAALLGPVGASFDDLTAYRLEQGGFGYREFVAIRIGSPALVLEWDEDRVERASVGSYMKGRPFPAPRDDD